MMILTKEVANMCKTTGPMFHQQTTLTLITLSIKFLKLKHLLDKPLISTRLRLIISLTLTFTITLML